MFVTKQLNDEKHATVFANKCLFGKYFPGVQLPETIAYRINGTWLTDSYRPLQQQQLDHLLRGEAEIVIKRATDSHGGKGVFFVSGENLLSQVDHTVKMISEDLVLQKPIRQHISLAKINPHSVNTIRHMTLLINGEVILCSSILRMGTKNARVDNISSGGITCGIKEDGRLKPFAYSAKGERFSRHPSSGVQFSTIMIPAYGQTIEMVKKLHRSFPFFHLIAWDIAIDENSTPLLVEGNFKKGGITSLQLCNGPLFGEKQSEVLQHINWKLPI